MEKTAFIDTNILIWGIKGELTSGQDESKVHRAKNLLKQLDQSNCAVMISSIVLAEILVRVPPEEHTAVMNAINEGFQIRSFDYPSALICSRLWNKKLDQRKEDPDCSKNHMKVDLMIAANAISEKADVIFSEDKHISNAVQGMIRCKSLPTISEQPSFFD
jgi:predicted nucleic acid-binding protein